MEPLNPDLSEQLYHGLYMPALWPPYAQAAVAEASEFREMPQGLKPRDLNFFNPESSLLYLPAALYSVGVQGNLNKLKPCMVSERNRNHSEIIADSGGFQIISGGLDGHDAKEREARFRWQHRVCDSGITLDVPTAALDNQNSQYSSFGDCLSDTLIFLEHYRQLQQETGFCLFNVLQGRTQEEADIWYDAVKQYQFRGWAFAGKLKSDWYQVIRRIFIMMEEELFGGKYFWLHFLGIGDLKTACLLTTLRDCLRDFYGDDGFHFSFDTSSPKQAAGRYKIVYSGYTLSADRFTLDRSTELDPNDYTLVGSDQPFPHPVSPIGQKLSMGDLYVRDGIYEDCRWDDLASYMLMNHNTYVTVSAIIAANNEIQKPRHHTYETIPSNLYQASEAMLEIFAANDMRAALERNKRYLDRA